MSKRKHSEIIEGYKQQLLKLNPGWNDTLLDYHDYKEKAVIRMTQLSKREYRTRLLRGADKVPGLSDGKFAKILDIDDPQTVSKWRKAHGIPYVKKPPQKAEVVPPLETPKAVSRLISLFKPETPPKAEVVVPPKLTEFHVTWNPQDMDSVWKARTKLYEHMEEATKACRLIQLKKESEYLEKKKTE